jgi:glycosyltransferase involved in cell wall biosynthesis
MGVSSPTILAAPTELELGLKDDSTPVNHVRSTAVDPKRVAFLTWWVRSGGPGWSQYYHIKNLDRQNIEPVAILPHRGIFGDRFDELGVQVVIPERFPEPNMHRHQAGKSFFGRILDSLHSVWDYLTLVPRLARVFKEQDIELVYCNELGMAMVGAPAAQLAGLPCVVHIRALDDPTTKWNPLWRIVGPILMSIAHLPAVKTVIANSDATAASLNSRLRRKVQVVYNGVDLKDYDPSLVPSGTLRTDFGIDDDVTIVGFTGHLQPRKGIDVMIRAAKRVLADHERVAFVVVGDNQVGAPVDYRSQYEAMAREAGISDRFIFAGFREDVRSAVLDFDIHCMPSYQEAFGRSLIEAMALGRSVVASHVGGIPEVVRDGIDGYLVPPGDPEALCEALVKLIDDRPLREKMGAAGLERVHEQFDVISLTQKIEDATLRAIPDAAKQVSAVLDLRENVDSVGDGKQVPVHAGADQPYDIRRAAGA